MPKEFIVAIELGSSKMTGIAGQKNLDGSITVLATVEEDSSSCIRKGVILDNDVLDTAYRATAHAYIDLGDILFQYILQLLDDVGQALASFVNVIDHTLSDARR